MATAESGEGHSTRTTATVNITMATVVAAQPERGHANRAHRQDGMAPLYAE